MEWEFGSDGIRRYLQAWNTEKPMTLWIKNIEGEGGGGPSYEGKIIRFQTEGAHYTLRCFL